MIGRFAAWVRFRWQNRRKPGRFNTQDLDRERLSHLPAGEEYDRTSDHWPQSGL